MPTNDFLPFAADPAANVITQGAWSALPARINGFASGLAQSSQVNKVWRQASAMASVLGQAIVDIGNLDALDDGNVTALLNGLKTAIRSGKLNYFSAPTGTANALVITPAPAVAALADIAGTALAIKTGGSANSGAMTLQVNALAATPVTWPDGTAIAAGDVPAGSLIVVRHDGSAFRMLLGLSPTQVRGLVPQTNLLINGDFQINQRAFAGGALASGIYGYDRWKADGSSNLSVSSYTLNITSGGIHQVIEPALWGFASLADMDLTISVDSPNQIVAVSLGTASGTIPAGSGRQSVTLHTGVGDSGNLSLKLGRSGGGAISFGRVKIEVGARATPWVARDAGSEIRLAERYYKTWRPGAVGGRLAVGLVTDAGLAQFNLPLAAELRAGPTVTYQNLNREGGSVVTLSSLYSSAVYRNVLSIAFNSATTSGGPFVVGLVAGNTNTHLTLDAEL
jgi:hypothetical protein